MMASHDSPIIPRQTRLGRKAFHSRFALSSIRPKDFYTLLMLDGYNYSLILQWNDLQ